MDDKEKVFTPTVIPDAPLPGQDADTIASTSNSTGSGVYAPKTVPDRALPRKVIAHETIASSLNTKSRKILGEYGFNESGALQIGKYESGLSGDIRISPEGLVARDQAGNTTFAIDGESGDAVFKGIVQARDFIAIDENGIVSLANFDFNIATGTGTQALSDVITDISGLTLTFDLVRPARVIFFFEGRVEVSGAGSAYVLAKLDGSTVGQPEGLRFIDQGDFYSHMGFHIAEVDSGSHTYKLVGHCGSSTTALVQRADSRLAYLVLGR